MEMKMVGEISGYAGLFGVLEKLLASGGKERVAPHAGYQGELQARVQLANKLRAGAKIKGDGRSNGRVEDTRDKSSGCVEKPPKCVMPVACLINLRPRYSKIISIGEVRLSLLCKKPLLPPVA